jgi:hypothetical protein
VTNLKNGTTLVHEDVAEAILEEVHMGQRRVIPISISEGARLNTLHEDVLTFTNASDVSHTNLLAYPSDISKSLANVNWLGALF